MTKQKREQKSKYIIIAASLLFVFGTLSLATKLKNVERLPAALSVEEKEMFELASAEDYLSGISIKNKNSEYLIEFKNLGQLCYDYDVFTLVFVSPNVHVSGEKPSLEISSHCNSKDGVSLSLSIPHEKLKQENPGDFSLAYRQPASIEVTVKDVIGFWPDYWRLSSIRFKNTNNGETKVFKEKQVSYYTNNSINMQW